MDITEATLGKDKPEYSINLNNLAGLLKTQVRMCLQRCRCSAYKHVWAAIELMLESGLDVCTLGEVSGGGVSIPPFDGNCSVNPWREPSGVLGDHEQFGGSSAEAGKS